MARPSDEYAKRSKALDELSAQAQELKLGYVTSPLKSFRKVRTADRRIECPAPAVRDAIPTKNPNNSAPQRQ